MKSLADYSRESLAADLLTAGLNPAAAPRIVREFWQHNGEIEFAEIDVAKTTRAWLRENVRPFHSRVAHQHRSADGTIKLLLEFKDGGTCECVLMPSHRPDRAAVCVSSQIGCAMGCDFCASTRDGLQRNLGVGEIAEQFLHLRKIASQMGRRISSLVFMGMGEPMHNLDNVIGAIHAIANSDRGNLGYRAMCVSTVGIVAGIDRLADLDLGVHLALSLHAPDDATRNALVPVNRKWKVADIMAAARRFSDRTNRPVNIEYCLLADVNDSDFHADALADLMADFRAHVNLIPHNPIGSGISGAVYRRPEESAVQRFLTRLRNRGIIAHTRQTRGDDVAAACGQLRSVEIGLPQRRVGSALTALSTISAT